jgi:outer membrane protein assembly factor BamB
MSFPTNRLGECLFCGCLVLTVVVCEASDWPMWRYDAARTAVAPTPLPDQLAPAWSRDLGPPLPAWRQEQDYHGKLEFDRTYQPIILGKRIIVPSMVSDRVTAYDTSTGDELWRFYADGPVRFAPAGGDGRVYFGSDDGYLYCLSATDGRLMWKVRGGPRERAVLGNERLIATWPVRGAPVLAEGRVYFGAGIWPFMGIFLHAVDAESGDVVWTNSGTGAIYNLHPHGGADAFGGVAPQGYLAVQGDRLVVGGGLSVPAVFQRHTGQFLHFEQSHAATEKGTGGFDVAAAGDFYFNAGRLFKFSDGKPRLLLASGLPLLATDHLTVLHEETLVDFAMDLQTVEVEVQDRKGETVKETRHVLHALRQAPLPVPVERLLMQSGSHIFALLKDGQVAALQWSQPPQQLEVVWQQRLPGTVDHLLSGDDRLFAVTREGWLHALASPRTDAPGSEPRVHQLPVAGDRSRPSRADDGWGEAAEAIVRQSGVEHGVALVWGLDSGRLVEELVARSEMHVIAVDEDPYRVEEVRRRWDDAQLYGRRAHVILATPQEFPFPPYLADLVVTERLERTGWHARMTDAESSAFFRQLFHPLRPYGGACWLNVPAPEQAALLAGAEAAPLVNAHLASRGPWVALSRVGALAGAGQWTHQYGSSANTVFSKDQLVKAPLGLLWFGGPTNLDALPRHGQGPIPQVAGGRLIMEGVNSLSGRCVYTGRTLWRREFPDIGFPYKANNHSFTEVVYINNQPGANFIGSNYVSLPDAIYVVYQDACQRLDPKTGETLMTLRLPPMPDEDQPAGWGYVGVWGDYLVAGASPHVFDDGRIGEDNWNATSSRRVVVMNRHTGEVFWSRDANNGFRHNAIVPAAGKLFLIDRLSEEALRLASRRGITPTATFSLTACDLATGEILWSTTENIFGTWLGYSEEHDVLIQAGRTGGRMPLPDEPTERIIAYRGSTGQPLWDAPHLYTGPLVIAGDRIISSGRKEGAVDLLTGQPRSRLHPVTGKELPWTHTRTYGCGTVLACENLLTFRSGAAGYFDLARDGGTGNFGGFKAGCTPNLVPAEGILNAPDYTRTCTCSYQNQTSLALIHDPEVETWTFSTLPSPGEGEAVRRIGINLSAPGDHLADDGTLWVEYPSIAGPSPDIPVEISAGSIDRSFCRHSSLLQPPATEDNPLATAAHRWVAASGIEGSLALKLTLEQGPDPAAKTYTIRLHFAEPEALAAGQRVFAVSLQDQRVETALDVVRATGGPGRPLVRAYPGVNVTDALIVELHAQTADHPPILCGIEIARDGD